MGLFCVTNILIKHMVLTKYQYKVFCAALKYNRQLSPYPFNFKWKFSYQVSQQVTSKKNIKWKPNVIKHLRFYQRKNITMSTYVNTQTPASVEQLPKLLCIPWQGKTIFKFHPNFTSVIIIQSLVAYVQELKVQCVLRFKTLKRQSLTVCAHAISLRCDWRKSVRV